MSLSRHPRRRCGIEAQVLASFRRARSSNNLALGLELEKLQRRDSNIRWSESPFLRGPQELPLVPR